jgi:hypothetical protein
MVFAQRDKTVTIPGESWQSPSFGTSWYEECPERGSGVERARARLT